MDTNILLEILKAYGLGSEIVDIYKIEIGHINDTYAFTLNNSLAKRYILQRINRRVFQDIEGLINNIVYVCDHLSKKIANAGGDVSREAMQILPTLKNKYYYEATDGEVYRIYDFVERSVCHIYAENKEQFRQAAITYAKFQKYLSDLDVKKITDTIPNFHDTRKRLEQFWIAVNNDTAKRAESAKKLIGFVKDREAYSDIIVSRLQNGLLPLRVTHNDTKINNILFDEKTDKGLCVIDFDTIMKGSMLYDFGDAIRFGCNTAKEDEKDLDKVLFDIDMYNAYESAYISELQGIMTEEERKLLKFSPLVMTYELVIRFLTDYLEGDIYFKIQYPEHNFYRARCQAKLLVEMEKKLKHKL